MLDDTVQAGAQQRVIAAVVTRGDRMLVSRRPEHKRHGGLWEFPGGKVGDGESDLEAISRELREELDVATVQVAEPVFVISDPGLPFMFVYVTVMIVDEY